MRLNPREQWDLNWQTSDFKVTLYPADLTLHMLYLAFPLLKHELLYSSFIAPPLVLPVSKQD